jgi:type IV secretory pathway TraG/TraD family ATPase VirD4
MRTGFGEEGHEPMFMASGPGPHGSSRNDRLAVETTARFGSDFAFGSGDYEIATRAAKFLADNRGAESIKSTTETTTAWMAKARRDDMSTTAGVDFRDCTRRPTTIYVIVPAAELRATGTYLRLIL